MGSQIGAVCLCLRAERAVQAAHVLPWPLEGGRGAGLGNCDAPWASKDNAECGSIGRLRYGASVVPVVCRRVRQRRPMRLDFVYDYATG